MITISHLPQDKVIISHILIHCNTSINPIVAVQLQPYYLLLVTMVSYCMNCVPLKPGVWAIALLQLLYSSVRIYMATQAKQEEGGFYFYLHFTAHCFGLAAAAILILGLL